MRYGRLLGLLFFCGLCLVESQTQRQIDFQENEFAQFMHFSVSTFANIEHNCVKNQTVSAQLFNPTNLSTDQWVMEAKNMGAKEICLTSHHEGGFCLWPTSWSEYSVKNSPWKQGKGDILKEFVNSCKKYGMKICYYFSASSDCYEQSLSPADFLKKQLLMISELITNYGPVNRFWFDHYGRGCGNFAYCPGGFPQYWMNVTQFVRKISPSTLMLPGADGCEGPGERGYGLYPVFNGFNQSCETELCAEGCTQGNENGAYYRPHEADLTIQNPGDQWFWHNGAPYLNASQLWEHYLATVGRGYSFILNIPPDTTGQIPDYFVKETRKLGQAISAFNVPLANTSALEHNCNQSVTLSWSKTKDFNAIVLQEAIRLTKQSVTAFTVQVKLATGWSNVTLANAQSIGYKLINTLTNPIYNATALQFTATSCVYPKFSLRTFAIYLIQSPQ